MMKLTLLSIKELRCNSDSRLVKHVCDYVIDRWSDYNDKKGIFTDAFITAANRELSVNLSIIRTLSHFTSNIGRRSTICSTKA